jgi:endonuclease YncB( thermonuclease family)
MKKRWSREQLQKFGVPAILIPGILLALALGWNPSKLLQSNYYYSNTNIFPKSGIVKTIVDGDTFALKNGVEVRLIGVNAPERGAGGFASASAILSYLIENQNVFLEYDRYQDDKYGRVLAWAWAGCESTPVFLPSDYMHLSGNASREGLMDNPQGCKDGKLINEELVKRGNAVSVSYTDRGELKYEKRLKNTNRK